MKINDAFPTNSYYLGPKLDSNESNNSKTSNLEVKGENLSKNKELNNNIGILQIANSSIQSILNNPNITLDDALSIISKAKFFGKNIFRADFVIRDEGGVVFDGNRVLSILPTDEKDLYIFKKALKKEQDLIMQSMQRLSKDESSDVVFDDGYLKKNANLFSKAHNTSSLSSKIDSLLV